MVQEMTLTNLTTQNSILIGDGTNSVYVLDSVDWDTPSVNVSTYRVPKQVGESFSSMVVGSRNPTIIGYVIADTRNIEAKAWDEYYQKQLEQIEKSKIVLDKLINIYYDICINVNGYELYARPVSPVKYANTETENNEVLCKFQIELKCFEPMFIKGKDVIGLTEVAGAFHFPFHVTNSEQLIFGQLKSKGNIVIENDGDIDSGCIITIRAIAGALVDPQVNNITTGEYIGLEGVTIPYGDYIEINTNTGEEEIVHHKATEGGTKKSLVGNITAGSTFFKISQGNGIYGFTIDEQYRNNAEVVIEFQQKYFNIRGM